MTARVSHTTIDCRDAYALSEWWKGVLDYVDVEGDPNLAGHEECMILSRDGSHRLLFIEVPEAKSGKNRIHLDLEPVEGRRDDELARLLEHGAVFEPAQSDEEIIMEIRRKIVALAEAADAEAKQKEETPGPY